MILPCGKLWRATALAALKLEKPLAKAAQSYGIETKATTNWKIRPRLFEQQMLSDKSSPAIPR